MLQLNGVAITVRMCITISPDYWYQATTDDSCFGLVRCHQHGIADICRDTFCKPLKGFEKLETHSTTFIRLYLFTL